MRDPHRTAGYGAVLGYLGDLLAGDPHHGHPVAVFGRAAASVERHLWRDHRAAGAAHTALCVGGVLAAGVGLTRWARAVSGRGTAATLPGPRPGTVRSRALATAPLILTAATTWAALGGSSLAREARAVALALEAGELAVARRRLPHLCGRDATTLTSDDIARAVVESVAENTSDATVGALVWGALAGVPGVAGFRAVNTLDAMVGHRSTRYRRFGWAAARLDDLAGWPGSRLTAVLTVLSGPCPQGAWRAWRADGDRHPSPNAGPVEAAFAGALGVRLGGRLSYGGRVEDRPSLNTAGRAVRVADIERAVRLSRRVSALALVLCAGGRLVAGRLVTPPSRGLRPGDAGQPAPSPVARRTVPAGAGR